MDTPNPSRDENGRPIIDIMLQTRTQGGSFNLDAETGSVSLVARTVDSPNVVPGNEVTAIDVRPPLPDMPNNVAEFRALVESQDVSNADVVIKDRALKPVRNIVAAIAPVENKPAAPDAPASDTSSK